MPASSYIKTMRPIGGTLDSEDVMAEKTDNKKGVERRRDGRAIYEDKRLKATRSFLLRVPREARLGEVEALLARFDERVRRLPWQR